VTCVCCVAIDDVYVNNVIVSPDAAATRAVVIIGNIYLDVRGVWRQVSAFCALYWSTSTAHGCTGGMTACFPRM